MDRATASLLLQAMIAWSAEPLLSAAELGFLLDGARRADAAGRVITDLLWAPTWDLNAAAAEGWRWKAAKEAGKYDFATGGEEFSESQQAKACLAMAEQFERKIVSSVSLPGTTRMTAAGVVLSIGEA